MTSCKITTSSLVKPLWCNRVSCIFLHNVFFFNFKDNYALDHSTIHKKFVHNGPNRPKLTKLDQRDQNRPNRPKWTKWAKVD